MESAADRARRVRELFEEVVNLSVEACAARISVIGREDRELGEEIRSLLDAYREADTVLRRVEHPGGREVMRVADALIGKAVSHYRVTEKLGGGGMGVVYKARDVRLDRIVALKFLPTYLRGDDEARARLLHEARAASALDHPSICTIYDIGESADGQVYLAMAFYEGETVEAKIAGGPLPLIQSVGYAVQIAEGLEKAEARGIFHRDIKPGNVLVTTEDQVKILDFGIAEMTGIELKASGAVHGTAAYMAPEMVQGGDIDHRTDLWSLGVMIYEMLTGCQPFDGEFYPALIYSILNEEPKSMTAVRPDVPPELERIVRKALAKNPDDRYQHAGALLSDLRPFGRAMITSIAVLPPSDFSRVPEQEYFFTGIYDALISSLARIGSLRVVSRSSAMHYRNTDKSIPEVAHDLNVDAVLEVSIQRNDARVDIQVRLIQAFPRERHLWTQTFSRALDEVDAMHGDVAQTLARKIQVKLSSDEETRLSTTRRVNPQTYEAYLKGMFHLGRSTPEDFERGLAYLHEGVETDPADPRAYTGLALGYITLGHGPNPPPGAWARARACAERAVRLDATLAEAWAALADVRLYYKWDWEGAEHAFEHANELNPSLAMNHYHYAWYLILMGRVEEAIAEHRRAQELDPLTPLHTVWIPGLFLSVGQDEKALELARQALAQFPDNHIALFVLGSSAALLGEHAEALAAHERMANINHAWKFALGRTYALAGRIDEARQILLELEALPPTSWGAFGLADLHAALGNADATFRWLNYDPPHAFMPWSRVSPTLRPFRGDSRFHALMRRLNLPEQID